MKFVAKFSENFSQHRGKNPSLINRTKLRSRRNISNIFSHFVTTYWRIYDDEKEKQLNIYLKMLTYENKVNNTRSLGTGANMHQRNATTLSIRQSITYTYDYEHTRIYIKTRNPFVRVSLAILQQFLSTGYKPQIKKPRLAPYR